MMRLLALRFAQVIIVRQRQAHAVVVNVFLGTGNPCFFFYVSVSAIYINFSAKPLTEGRDQRIGRIGQQSRGVACSL